MFAKIVKSEVSPALERAVITSANAGLCITKTEGGYRISKPGPSPSLFSYTVADINELSLVIDALDWFQNG